MMLEKTKSARFIGIDWDPEALECAQNRLAVYKERVMLFRDNFARLDSILNTLNVKHLDGVLFDLGASLHQLTAPDRGFSFNYDGMLSMQMSPEAVPLYQKLSYASEKTVYEILKKYGDVHRARSIAHSIFENRQHLRTTFELRNLVEKHCPRRFLKKNLHCIFQAFRIWVNDELANLQKGLVKAIDRLIPYGRVVVIAYHSGEDRIVKNMMRNYEREEKIRRLNRKVIRPSNTEIGMNPAARSARMRVGEKCE